MKTGENTTLLDDLQNWRNEKGGLQDCEIRHTALQRVVHDIGYKGNG